MSALLHALLAELEAADQITLEALRMHLAIPSPEGVGPGENPAERLLTCSEAAERARVHPETIRRAARQGKLPALRAGRELRIWTGDLERWLGHQEPQLERLRQDLERRRATRGPMRDALARFDSSRLDGHSR
ncbi:MAG TPA: helix-turn-helix domain-containing protein [Solirubrobacteraceae bacterium]|jgi:excisionase family DNA binding protein